MIQYATTYIVKNWRRERAVGAQYILCIFMLLYWFDTMPNQIKMDQVGFEYTDMSIPQRVVSLWRYDSTLQPVEISRKLHLLELGSQYRE